jgi:tetratricopeptide (TPR) repeat protein
MKKDIDHDLKDFQSKVYRNYRYSLMREVQKAELISKRGYAGFEYNSDSNFAARCIKRLLRSFERFANDRFFKTPDFLRLEANAESILNHTKIRELLCKQFGERIHPGLLKEELETEVVSIVTKQLTNGPIVETFPIEKDIRLFSMLVYKILQRDISEFCSENKLSPVNEDSSSNVDISGAAEVEHQNPHFFYDWGLYYYEQGKYDLAIADFTKAIESNSQDYDAFNNRGLCFQNQGKLDLAVADYSRAAEINSEFAPAFYNRGGAYYAQDKFNQALSDFTKVIEANSLDYDAYFNRALAYNRLGESSLAIADFTTAIAIGPENAEVYFNRGYVYNEQGKYDLAIADFTNALEIDARYSGAFFGLATSYCHQDRFDLAIENFSKAILIDPDYADAYVARAHLFCITGEKDSALQDEKKAIELGAIINEKCQ